jgi:hypothetical protein
MSMHVAVAGAVIALASAAGGKLEAVVGKFVFKLTSS